MKILSRLLIRILPYDRMVWLADKRQEYMWRRDKGAQELRWFNWLKHKFVKCVKYVLYLSGASMGIKLIPFLPQEMFDKMFEWWPWIGRQIIWLSDNLSKEMIIYIMIGYLAGDMVMAIIRYVCGMGFEKSKFERAEQLARNKKYNYFMMEEIVEPLQRIEKRLGTKSKRDES